MSNRTTGLIISKMCIPMSEAEVTLHQESPSFIFSIQYRSFIFSSSKVLNSSQFSGSLWNIKYLYQGIWNPIWKCRPLFPPQPDDNFISHTNHLPQSYRKVSTNTVSKVLLIQLAQYSKYNCNKIKNEVLKMKEIQMFLGSGRFASD